ncbi:uncharacterized protein LOC111865523 [Cryptotermes secundus]|uniref:uncharacterized protein LOC111865523 n=1 Tax=Cryptotermes secundus TaxID=105785 RepID=UPI000CD7BB0B|nr:uncharacterized protein LOC111865523 [Cryptotermes secundus]
MSLARIILLGIVPLAASSYEPSESTGINVYGDPTQTSSIDDILKRPLFVITNTNPNEEELSGYVTEGGLSALANDPEGKDTYEALRRGGDTALLLHPSFLSSPYLKSTAGSALATRFRLPSFAMLAFLVSVAIRIPWLLMGYPKKNSTSTPTFKRENFVKLFHLELSDQSVEILEALDQLPTSVVENL